MEGDAVARMPFSSLLALISTPSGLLEPVSCRARNGRRHQTQENQREGNDVEGEEAVEGRVAHDEVAADQDRQIVADERNGPEQVPRSPGAPVGHLPQGSR